MCPNNLKKFLQHTRILVRDVTTFLAFVVLNSYVCVLLEFSFVSTY